MRIGFADNRPLTTNHGEEKENETDAAGRFKEKHYWPMVYTSFWLEHKLWGFAPAGYHIVNVLLHLVNVLLLWRLMLRLTVPGAWLIAAVFAVHPTHVESVAWIIERKDVLSALFYLTAVLAYLRFLERESQHWYYVLALVLFCAGMLSKSIVVTLPAALLIVRWWMCGRIRARDLLHTGPFFAVGLCIAVLTCGLSGPGHPSFSTTLWPSGHSSLRVRSGFMWASCCGRCI